MKILSFVLGMLCVAGASTNVAWSATQGGGRPDKAEKTQAGFTRTLIDRDAARSIEIITDRHESVAQFFARQRLVIADAPMIGVKPVSIESLLKGNTTREVFVSYPLYNDAGLTLSSYGDWFDLLPPSPHIADAFQSPSKFDTYLILAFDDQKTETKLGVIAPRQRRKVHLVGRIQIVGDWKPESEKQLFTFAPPSAPSDSH